MISTKFRAWNKKTNKMYPVDELMMLWSGKPEPIFQRKFEDDLRITDGILMQFIGHVDKNSKEIYQGDLVKAPYDDLNEFKEVVWYKGCFGYNLCGDHKPFFEFHSDDLEVLGNVYENPELLKKVKK